MNTVPKSLCLGVILSLSGSLYADTNPYNNNSEKMVEYFQNFGSYLGYDVSTPPDSPKKASPLLNADKSTLIAQMAYMWLLGATPVNAFNTGLQQFLPTSMESASSINSFANYVFAYQKEGSYKSDSSSSGAVSVIEGIDQQTYQKDPVSQGILNILGTPNDSVCKNNDGTAWIKNCDFLTQGQVAVNNIGPLPRADEFYSYTNLEDIIPQLNSNTLLGPMVFDQVDPNSNSTSSPPAGGTGSPKGLQAINQAQTASNFLRYVTGSVTPIALATQQSYDQYYTTAVSDNASEMDKNDAKAKLATYLGNLRSYSARMSVGLGNLYYIFSKRMPQEYSGTQSSHALNEFNMATRRLYAPKTGENKSQWIDEINSAPTATVQKEIALLLAEINYQMYLSRQQQERILLTNTIMMLINTQTMQPSDTVGNDPSVDDSVQ